MLLARISISMAYSLIVCTQNTAYLFPEPTAFEERLRRRCLDVTVISTAK
jgi:hypothetical protein